MGIRDLDSEGMTEIEDLNLAGFVEYPEHTKNTICGQDPIAVLLAAVEEIQKKHLNESSDTVGFPLLRFLHYAQSNRVTKASDSSVSYAAAKLAFENSVASDKDNELDEEAIVAGYYLP